jgi:hypothetical protein
MSTAEGPPLPKLALNVGVTGHRPKDLTEAHLDTLRERIREVLEFIKEFATNLAGIEYYYTNPRNPVLRVISALAEGADRHVAHQALAVGFELQCPLPFDRIEYAQDFASEGSVLEFNNLLNHEHTTAVLELDGTREREADSYLAAGRIILSQSNVLIAVWNGEIRNKKGGTSQIVIEARQRNLPTVWINSQPPHDVYIRTSDSKWSPWAVGSASLVIGTEALLRPPDNPKTAEEVPTSAEGYFSETQPAKNWGCVWLPFRKFCAERKWTRPTFSIEEFSLSGRQQWQPILQNSALFAEETVERMHARHLFEHYGWADGLAGYYGNLYRSAFVVNYLLSAFAVLFAFLHFACESHETLSRAFTIIEIVLLLSVAFLYYFGRKWDWHQRWIDYRLLAEYVRQLFFLIPIGPGELSSPNIPTHMAAGDPRTTWMHWLYRAVRRDTGLIRAKFDAAYLKSLCSFICSENGIGGQVNYHKANAERLEAMDKRFTKWTKWLFRFAILAALAALLFGHDKIANWLALLPLPALSPTDWLAAGILAGLAGVATVFPAVGASLAGIRSQAEFERVKKRSKVMHQRLEQILARLNPTNNPDHAISSAELSAAVAEAGQLMVDELLDWRIVFEERPLPEPE